MALELSHLVVFIISLIGLLCLYLIVSLYFLKKYQTINKERVSEQKDYFPLFYFVAFLFLSIGRLFLAIFDVITEFDSNNYTLENFVIWKIGTAFQLCAWGLFFIVIEKKAMKGRDKYILFILYATFCILGLILNDIVWFKPNASPNLSCRYFTASHETLIWARKEKKAKHKFNYELMRDGNWPEDFIKKPNLQMRSVWAIAPPKKEEKPKKGKED